MTQNPRNAFRQCALCRRLATLQNLDEIVCPVYAQEASSTPDADEEHSLSNTIRDFTPVSQWQSPKRIGNRYGYSAKHVLRLAHENNIPTISLSGRWLILRCAFELYLLDNNK